MAYGRVANARARHVLNHQRGLVIVAAAVFDDDVLEYVVGALGPFEVNAIPVARNLFDSGEGDRIFLGTLGIEHAAALDCDSDARSHEYGGAGLDVDSSTAKDDFVVVDTPAAVERQLAGDINDIGGGFSRLRCARAEVIFRFPGRYTTAHRQYNCKCNYVKFLDCFHWISPSMVGAEEKPLTP